MTQQFALLFPAGSQPVDTSEAAADSLSLDHLARLRRDVLAFIASRGSHGATPDEIAVAFQCDHNHTSPRVTELASVGLIERTSLRRPTRKGRMAGVYVLHARAYQP